MQEHSTWVETVLPTLLGTGLGAALAYVIGKARGREDHERTLELLVVQDERRAAQAALEGARDVRIRANSGDQSYGLLHNAWSDTVLASARLIRDDDLRERARSGAYAIFLGTVTPGQHVSYVVTRGALDVEQWAEAWLRRDKPPPAHLPQLEKIHKLVIKDGRVDLDPLNDYLAARDTNPLPT